MATEPIMYVGTRGAKIYELNAYERINGSSTTAYSGLDLYGFKGLDMTYPEPVQKTHMGNDRILATQLFPPTDAVSGTLLAGAQDNDVIAAVSGIAVNDGNVAGASFIMNGTDKQGSEPNVAILSWQEGITESGSQVYHWKVVYNTKCIPVSVGMGADPIDYQYKLAPSPVSNHVYGAAISIANDGATSGTDADGYTSYPLNMVAFVADGIEDEFTFPLLEQAADTTNITVFLAAAGSENLTEVTTGITKATTGVTWDAAPADGSEIIIVYQMDV